MKYIKEFFVKLLAVYHIFKDKEYAVYSVTIKNENGKSKIKSIYCAMSETTSKIFLDTIIEYTEKQK